MRTDGTNRALGDLAMIFDIIPTVHRPKMAPDGPVDPGTPEFDLMLATIVFDLAKKQALAHKALRSYLLHADPELTERIIRDVRELEPYDQDYATLARLTEAKMLEAVEEVAEDHIELAMILARWADGHRPPNPDPDQSGDDDGEDDD